MSEMNPLTRTTENGSSKELDLQALKDAAYRTGDVQLAAQIAQLCDEHAALKNEISELRKALEDLNDSLLIEIARDRQRITALERPVFGPNARARIDELHGLMRKHRLQQITFSEAAKLLDITRQRANQLKPLIEDDDRFVLVKDPHHDQRILIRLNTQQNLTKSNRKI